LKTYFRDIKAKLINYQQDYIPLQMYLKWCDEIGLTESHANDLLKALHFSCDILHFRDLPELKNFIFLKPQAVTDTLIKELQITFATRNVPQLVEQLERILPEFIPLNEKKLSLDERAQRSAKLWMIGGLGYLLLQFGILARMVWIDFNWDIMEPISYFVSLSTLMLGYIFFVLYREEYTYAGLEHRQKLKALRKLYINEEFNWKQWNELNLEVQRIKSLLGPHFSKYIQEGDTLRKHIL